MAENSNGPDPANDADRAAAEWLFQDDPAPSKPAKPPVVAPGGESFDLADVPGPPVRRPTVPPPSDGEIDASPPRTEAVPRRAPIIEGDAPQRREPVRDRPAARRRDQAPAVDHPWTRGAEWGPTIAAMVAWAIAAWIVIYLLLVAELYPAALAMFAVGTAVGLALFYPIVITLERPTRMTPEQALRDYYQALSHHFPHYRRMWLLLSNAGRTSSKFASFEGFKRYWKERIGRLREGKAKGTTPLVFLVSDFRSEKSGGKTEIDGTWTVQVFVRGRREQGPIWSFAVDGSFAKGPDNMWYLDDGTLAERPARRTAKAE